MKNGQMAAVRVKLSGSVNPSIESATEAPQRHVSAQAPYSAALPRKRVFSSRSLNGGTSRLSGAGPFRIRPEWS
jgi:hypothetical protein